MTTDTSTQIAGEPATRPRRRRLRRRSKVTAGTVVVLAGAAVALAVAGPFGGSPSSSDSQQTAIATAAVTRRTLTSQMQVDATLGYAGSYSVVFPASGAAGGTTGQTPGSPGSPGSTSAGTFTRLPVEGQVITRGHALYAVDGAPTMLLYGPTPAYRTLSVGMRGADVRELNANLVALADASHTQLNPHSDYYGAATATAVRKVQHRLGLPETGTLSLGQVTFLPSAARVSSVNAVLGGPAQPGSPVLQATSTTREVTAHLDATQQTQVKAGDRVKITLPDNRTTPGTVTLVGTVATTGSSNSSEGAAGSNSGGSQTPTIDVHIRPMHPAATGRLDQAPVSVTITTGSVRNALTVPVAALLARASGGYAVEVVDPDGTHRPVPVRLGLFDDADGLVQVSGSGLSAGQHVEVPNI